MAGAAGAFEWGIAVKLGVKLAAGAAALAMMLGAAQASQAAIVDWTLSNGTFDDGGTFFGAFQVDTSTDTITDWNVTTTSGLFGTNYAVGSGGGGPFLTFNDAFDSGSGPSFSQSYLFFFNGFDLTNIPLGGPGSVAHLAGRETAYIFRPFLSSRTVTGGQAVGLLAGGVPEPATWLMMILGAGLAGTKLRQRRRQVICA
jgi:hypothetical protein